MNNPIGYGRSVRTALGMRIEKIKAQLARLKARREAAERQALDCMVRMEQLSKELAIVCGHKEAEFVGFSGPMILRCKKCGFEGAKFYFPQEAWPQEETNEYPGGLAW